MGPNEIHNVIKDILCGKQIKVNIGEKLVILSFCNKNLKYLKLINNIINIILINILVAIYIILFDDNIWTLVTLVYIYGFGLTIKYFFIKKSINTLNYIKFKLTVPERN